MKEEQQKLDKELQKITEQEHNIEQQKRERERLRP